MSQLRELYAFVAPDADGNEAVAAVQTPQKVWVPLVATTKELIEQYRPLAKQLAEVVGTVTMVRFTDRVDVEKIT